VSSMRRRPARMLQGDNGGTSRKLRLTVVRVALRAPLGAMGLVIVILALLAAVLAPAIAPHSPVQMALGSRLAPPLHSSGSGGSRNWLGTDQLGRDVLSRIIYGTRVSLIVGSLSVAFASVVGVSLGLGAGYWRGALDAVVMRTVDLQLSFPFILLAMAIVALLGPSVRNIILVFVVTSWPVYARVSRASVLVVRSQQYVEAARSLGAHWPRILLRHVLPNILAPVIVVASFETARVIIVEAALGFLGLGVPPPTPTWGGMLADGRAYIRDAWWLSTFPGLAIVLLASGVNFLGDALRDALDPRMRGRYS
jgi:peptide/nickel transport system permease protein